MSITTSFNTNPDPAAQWARIREELIQYRDAQQAMWGNVDDVTVGKYLAGEATDAEQAQIETEMQSHPTLAEAIHLVREVLKSDI